MNLQKKNGRSKEENIFAFSFPKDDTEKEKWRNAVLNANFVIKKEHWLL